MSELKYEEDFPFAARKCKEIAREMAEMWKPEHVGNFEEGREDVLIFMAKMIEVHAQMEIMKSQQYLYQEMRGTGRDGDALFYEERVLQPSEKELEELRGELHDAYENLAINRTTNNPVRQVYELYDQQMYEYNKGGRAVTVKPEDSP